MVEILADILHILEGDDAPLATGSGFRPPADIFFDEMTPTPTEIEENGTTCALAPYTGNSSDAWIQGRVSVIDGPQLAPNPDESLGEASKCNLEPFLSSYNSAVPVANKG